MNSQDFILFLQAFLDFRGFDFRDFDFFDFWFTAVYNSILFSSLLVLIINLYLRGFCFRVFFVCPHINSANRVMPVYPKLSSSYLVGRNFQK